MAAINSKTNNLNWVASLTNRLQCHACGFLLYAYWSSIRFLYRLSNWRFNRV
jgi:hypothetical protein